MDISLLLPVYNEEENIELLVRELLEVIKTNSLDAEIIFINDGSRDNSFALLKKIALNNTRVKVINFNRNFGQTAAMSAGIDYAQGDIIIPMDADMQNDPKDIVRLFSKIKEGFDIVSGWRKNRQDKLISRKLPSWTANYLISIITKVYLHDYGCTIKAYRKEVLKNIKFYGEMHRLIPAYASWYGAKISEIEVNHRPRKFGVTKYGISRTFRVVLDLLTVKFLIQYSTRPMHFFGGIGFVSLFLGLSSFCFALFLRFVHFASLIQTPLPLLSALLIIISIQFFLMGLLAEMVMRGYYEGQNKKIYIVKDKINID